MIIPISFISTPRMSNIREIIEQNTLTYCINFADRPGTLFNGVHQKVSIFITQIKKSIQKATFTSSFLHWYSKDKSNERNSLLTNFNFTNTIIKPEFNAWLKIGNEIENSIWEKILKVKNNPVFIDKSKNICIYLNMRMMFWAKCFLNSKKSKEFKSLYFNSQNEKYVNLAAYNSNLFFYFWESISDCWHITQREINLFQINYNSISDFKFYHDLSIALENDLENKKKFVGTVQTDYEYYHKKSKHIIDEIDKVLAKHYGFTEEELDFIINYDIKYRMGKELEDDTE